MLFSGTSHILHAKNKCQSNKPHHTPNDKIQNFLGHRFLKKRPQIACAKSHAKEPGKGGNNQSSAGGKSFNQRSKAKTVHEGLVSLTSTTLTPYIQPHEQFHQLVLTSFEGNVRRYKLEDWKTWVYLQ